MSNSLVMRLSPAIGAPSAACEGATRGPPANFRRGLSGRFHERRDSGVYFQPFSNPLGTTRESLYRLYGRSLGGYASAGK